MAGNGNHLGQEKRPHEEFLELCAISTTGELTEEEQAKLREHVAVCAECRQALKEFEATADIGAPLLAAELVNQDQRDSASAMSAEVPEGTTVRSASVEAASISNPERLAPILTRRNGRRRAEVNWNYVWLPFAAAVVLTIALGIYAYEIGRRHSPSLVGASAVAGDAGLNALERLLSDAGHERAVLKAELDEQDGTIRQLKRQIANESAALADAKNTQASLERSLQDALSSRQEIAQQQNSASQNLNAAQASLQRMQAELDLVRQQRGENEAHASSLEGQIKDLNAQLRQSQQAAAKQEDLLAEDRDIRDLMGARDLYIAEVYDVARDGATQKPYGRMFYTKGKSLIFYAYDLDQQPGVKEASTFQAWGQNGPDRQQALSLGIFYQDSVANKRWVLKVDDPRALEQINAVFVTVEPHGGSRKPSGKPLLFASLRIDANHP
jgi:hypothetical protein